MSLFQGIFEVSSELFYEFDQLPKRIISADSLGFELWAAKIIFLSIESKGDLYNLHTEVVRRFNPLRAKGKGPADKQNFSGLPKQEEQSIAKFDFPFCFDSFKPHFTLGHTQDPNRILETLSKQDIPSKFRLQRLSLFEVGVAGKIEKVLKSKDLQYLGP